MGAYHWMIFYSLWITSSALSQDEIDDIGNAIITDVTGEQGKDTVLPCPVSMGMEDRLLTQYQWFKFDYNIDNTSLRLNEYEVAFYNNVREEEVSTSGGDLTDRAEIDSSSGDLRILKTELDDSYIYVCYFRLDGYGQVNLTVIGGDGGGGGGVVVVASVVPILLVLGVAAALIAGYIYYRRRSRQKKEVKVLPMPDGPSRKDDRNKPIVDDSDLYEPVNYGLNNQASGQGGRKPWLTAEIPVSEDDGNDNTAYYQNEDGELYVNVPHGQAVEEGLSQSGVTPAQISVKPQIPPRGIKAY